MSEQDSYIMQAAALRSKVVNNEHVVLETSCLTCDEAFLRSTEGITTRALLRKTELESDAYSEYVSKQIDDRQAEEDRIGQIDAEMDRQRELSSMPEYTEW